MLSITEGSRRLIAEITLKRPDPNCLTKVRTKVVLT
jgi:hypothetical protein